MEEQIKQRDIMEEALATAKHLSEELEHLLIEAKHAKAPSADLSGRIVEINRQYAGAMEQYLSAYKQVYHT